MPEPVQYQYVLPLTLLDEVEATFSQDNNREESAVMLTIPTQHWINLGRPGLVRATVDPLNGAQ